MLYLKLKGTYDIPPAESDFFEEAENLMKEIAKSYCYKKVAFPILEYAALFTRGVGESSDIVVKKEMYVFEDRGHRLIALRPEGTAGAVRLYLENGLAMQGYSAKMCYLGPMFRAENPQAGRYRQFNQFGAEYIGDGSPAVDVELIQMNQDLFEKLSIKDINIYINSIGCKECRPAYLEKLKAYFADKIGKMCADCGKRFETNVLRILDCKEESCRPFIDSAPIQLDSLCPACGEHFSEVKKGLENLKVLYEIDPRLVRGLDYYNRTVFEIKSKLLGSQSTISAGGRYDYLVKELGGMETPAAGFALGLERLSMAIEASRNVKRADFYRPPLVYLAAIGRENQSKAMEAASLFRKKGIPAVTEYRYDSLKKHLKSADAMKAVYALFIGEEEIKNNAYVLRNLSDGTQTTGNLEEIAGFLTSVPL
jgi:histidyl-tRNA synthetase